MTTLENKKVNLENKLFWELREYRELQKYFIRTNSPSEAEMLYYSDRFSESGYISEGLFSLNFNTTLFKEIKKNKEQRNKITSEIKNLKEKIRSEHNGHSLLFLRKKKIEQIKKNI